MSWVESFNDDLLEYIRIVADMEIDPSVKVVNLETDVDFGDDMMVVYIDVQPNGIMVEGSFADFMQWVSYKTGRVNDKG